MDALDKGVRRVESTRRRVGPLLEKAPIPEALRERLRLHDEPIESVPEPEQNRSPFAKPETPDQPQGPLGDEECAAQLYGKSSCPWTGRTQQLLRDYDVEHDFIDLATKEGSRFGPRLIAETKQHESPYVFLRGEFIGGFNALSEIVRLGQLDEMTTAEGDRRQAEGRTRIVIAKRSDADAPPGERGNPDDRD